MIHYLSRTEVAERIGVQPSTLGRYKLPDPDATVGSTRGWLPETVDAWNAARPGKGAGAGRKPKVRVTAHRWPGGWELHRDGEVLTQVSSLDDAVGQVRDYLDTIDPGTDHSRWVVEVQEA